MPRQAFTLLEVILALALATAVLVILASTVAVQLRSHQAGRAAVEEAQLARALLRRMADDLRSAVPDPSAGYPVGTLVGTRAELQVTIRRALPRSRAAIAAAVASLPADRLSDLWIVNYRRADGPGGLVRVERDYATAAWAVAQGKPDAWRSVPTAVAPEVEALEFVYFQDGTAREQWDSSRQGRLPSAVRINVTVRRVPRTRSFLIEETAEDQRTSTVYSLLVALPGPRPPLEQPVAEEPAAEKQATPVEPSESSNP
jgi:type II secretory pathway pseudopilin PulG